MKHVCDHDCLHAGAPPDRLEALGDYLWLRDEVQRLRQQADMYERLAKRLLVDLPQSVGRDFPLPPV